MRTVKERELPDVDDDFAQLASEFDTLDELRADLSERAAAGSSSIEQLYAARDKALEALVAAADVPAPEGSCATRSSSRKQAMADQLERMGASLEDYLASRGQDRGGARRGADRGGDRGREDPAAAGRLRRRRRSSQVTDDEYGHEVVHRAQRRRHGAAAVLRPARPGRHGGVGLRRRTPRQGAGRAARAGDDQGLGRRAGLLDELRETTRTPTTRRPRGPRPRLTATRSAAALTAKSRPVAGRASERPARVAHSWRELKGRETKGLP